MRRNPSQRPCTKLALMSISLRDILRASTLAAWWVRPAVAPNAPRAVAQAQDA